MTQDQQLKIQAWIDGELPPGEAARVEAFVGEHPEARALADNLRSFRETVRAHEPRPLPGVTREFYWSRISREIAASAPTSPSVPAREPRDEGRSVFGWLAWIIPAGAAAIAALAFLRPATTPPDGVPGDRRTGSITMVGHEIEAPSDDITTLTFYSAADSVTVVWVGNAELL